MKKRKKKRGNALSVPSSPREIAPRSPPHPIRGKKNGKGKKKRKEKGGGSPSIGTPRRSPDGKRGKRKGKKKHPEFGHSGRRLVGTHLDVPRKRKRGRKKKRVRRGGGKDRGS